MNFHTGDPSNYSFNSTCSERTSSDEDDAFSSRVREQLGIIDQKQQMVLNQFQINYVVTNHHFHESHNTRRGGSVPGRIEINRDQVAVHQRLYNDYFADSPMYTNLMFKRRFKMSRRLFLKIMEGIQTHDDYFLQKTDGIGRVGLSPYQKMCAALWILAYGVAADATDEYIKIGESTAIESTKRFVRAVVEVFGDVYLRSPNVNDVARLLHIGKQRGFPGMLGSLDCMHWRWKNCPTAWAGQYSGRSGKPTIILEVVADYDLWIWHAYFDLPGSNNDINVLSKSHLFANLANGVAHPANFEIQGKQYFMGYYVADGIYPKWATLVQTIHNPRSPKQQYFATKQESCRKDVERAFGVLQAKWTIIAGPVRNWSKRELQYIMTACIIMHNMIIEDERDDDAPITNYREAPVPEVEIAHGERAGFEEFFARHCQIKDKKAHFALRDALIDHLWEEYSNSQNF